MTISELRVLVVVRHGEAVSRSPQGDIGRELSTRGQEDARALGAWLTEQGVDPDVAVVSPSVRTQQTWAHMVAGGLASAEVVTDRAVYEAEVPDLVETVASLPEGARTAVLVGHAPGIPALVASLEAHTQLPEGWPPATSAVIAHPGEWSEFPAEGTVVVRCREPQAEV